MKLNKTWVLSVSLGGAMLILGGCTSTASVPHQAMSEAKQAISHVKTYLSEQPTETHQADKADKEDYQFAIRLLQAGEEALNQGKHRTATVLINTSKKHAQAILRRRQQRTDNIKFRY